MSKQYCENDLIVVETCNKKNIKVRSISFILWTIFTAETETK